MPQGGRPALIIQNEVANRQSPITVVAAVTSGTSRAQWVMA